MRRDGARRPPELVRGRRVELRRRRATAAESAELLRIIDESREHLARWMPWAADPDPAGPVGYLEQAERGWESGEEYQYAVLTGGQQIGSLGLMGRIGPGALECGYWLREAWTGRGLMTEAVAMATEAAFGLAGVERVEIHHDLANHRSGAIPRRLGFAESGREPRPRSTPGESGVEVRWGLEKALWIERGGAAGHSV